MTANAQFSHQEEYLEQKRYRKKSDKKWYQSDPPAAGDVLVDALDPQHGVPQPGAIGGVHPVQKLHRYVLLLKRNIIWNSVGANIRLDVNFANIL